jgi:serine O-acetyltransferase
LHNISTGNYWWKIIGDAKAGNYPKIKDNVVIFAGAKLIGNINVGEHSIIGANSVVNKNVPSNSVVAGVPAKIIKNICYE